MMIICWHWGFSIFRKNHFNSNLFLFHGVCWFVMDGISEHSLALSKQEPSALKDLKDLKSNSFGHTNRMEGSDLASPCFTYHVGDTQDLKIEWTPIFGRISHVHMDSCGFWVSITGLPSWILSMRVAGENPQRHGHLSSRCLRGNTSPQLFFVASAPRRHE